MKKVTKKTTKKTVKKTVKKTEKPVKKVAKKTSTKLVVSKQANVESMLRELGATLLPDGPRHELRCEIRSETSDRLYIVSHLKAGGPNEWQCSCMGWIRYRHCKHLNAMVPSLSKALKLIKG